jgi:immunoglobulin-like protein involved in spore germination/sporulation and spore germination protein
MWIEGEKTLGVLTESMKLLLAGPPAGSGLETEIPDGVEVRDLGFANGTATVDLSAPPLSKGAKTVVPVGQIVYTLTQYPTVKRVEIMVDGGSLGVAGTSADIFKRGPFWEQYLPAIVVLTPTGLDPVASPLSVTGTADVFEANVTIKILDEDGKELASTFTTATCGTGCRGTFAKRVAFEADKGAKITLVVADDDADGDGKPSHEVRVPLEVG